MDRTGVSAAADAQEYGGGTTRTRGLPEASPSGRRLVPCTPVIPGRFSDIIEKTFRGHLNGGREVFPSKQSLCHIGIITDRTQLLTLASVNYGLWSAIAYSLTIPKGRSTKALDSESGELFERCGLHACLFSSHDSGLFCYLGSP